MLSFFRLCFFFCASSSLLRASATCPPPSFLLRCGRGVRDVLALTQLLDEIPNADSTRLGMHGWSRGGMQTYIAAKSLPNIKAIAVGAGNSDEEMALKIRPKFEKMLIKRVPNFKDNRAEELKKRSVIKWTDKLPKKAPILLLHGDKDLLPRNLILHPNSNCSRL